MSITYCTLTLNSRRGCASFGAFASIGEVGFTSHVMTVKRAMQLEMLNTAFKSDKGGLLVVRCYKAVMP